MKSDIKSDRYATADNIVGVVGDDKNPLRNGPRKSHKKFQLSKLRIVDRRSKLLEGTVCVGWGGVGWIPRHSSVPAAFARMLRKLQQLQKLQQMRWDNILLLGEVEIAKLQNLQKISSVN